MEKARQNQIAAVAIHFIKLVGNHCVLSSDFPSPITNGGGLYAPLYLGFFCHSLKISFGNPYLKILDLAKLFVADANMNY